MANLSLIYFWSGLAILFYTYIGYGILVFILAKLKARKSIIPITYTEDQWPHVTMVIAAYNEASCILEKMENTLQLDYPRQKLHVMVVTDGSTDETPDLVRRFDWVRTFHRPERKGKIHAVNRVMAEVDTPIVIFSDANSFLNSLALKNLVRHYQDPNVGGVSGEKRIMKKQEDNAPGAGEGLYWKYESLLKKLDSELYTVVGAAGELFSVRTALYEPPQANMIIEDFYISLRIVAKGYRFKYEPEACAEESASASVEDEWKRKVRIAAGGLQAICRLYPLLNPVRYGIVSFQYISHRVLRWTLAPLSLPLVLVSNIFLASSGVRFYQILLVGQLGFYLLAALGYFYRGRRITLKGFFVPFYFLVMNLSVFAGFVRFISGRQSVVWEKTTRSLAG